MNAEETDTDTLVELLRLGTSDLFYNDAAVGLVSRHRHWLERRDFRQFVEIFDEPEVAERCAGIWWEKAITALDRGDLPADHEQANVLRAAASIATFYQVSLRDISERLSPGAMKLMAEALMQAGGYTESVAIPKL